MLTIRIISRPAAAGQLFVSSKATWKHDAFVGSRRASYHAASALRCLRVSRPVSPASLLLTAIRRNSTPHPSAAHVEPRRPLLMRFIVAIALTLVTVGALSCQIELPPRARVATQISLAWVRTAHGWERPGDWYAPPVHPPTLHPLVVAVGEFLTSSLALLACCRHD